MARTHRIACLQGDGIGKETVTEALKVLDAASRRFAFDLSYKHYDWSYETCQKTGAMMRLDGLGRLRDSDSIQRRGRLAGRAGPHLAIGPADPDPPLLRPIREPAPLTSCCPACALRNVSTTLIQPGSAFKLNSTASVLSGGPATPHHLFASFIHRGPEQTPGPGLDQAIDAFGGAAEQFRFLGRRISCRQTFESVPQNWVA